MPESITQPLLETKRKAQQIAWLLQEKHGPERFAWVEHENKIFYSVLSRQSLLPMTAVTQLIQYLFESYIDHSFFILRQRIYTTEVLSDLCQSMIRMTAKRATGEIFPKNNHLQLAQEFVQISGIQDSWIESSYRQDLQFQMPTFVHQADAAKILEQMKSQIPRGEVLHDYNRAIVAILCDDQGQVLAYAANNNSKNKTLHAEICLMQDFWRQNQKSVPAGSVIYVSLKPCRMCSEMIIRSCENASATKVYFLENDPGPLAKDTRLEKLGILRKI